MFRPSIYPVLGILLFSLTLGCVFVQQPGKADAVAVWQHQGSTWDIYYSIWDHDGKQWYVPGGGKSAPIAVDAGDDHDPDVSTNDNAALAVWQKQTGGNTIYYSIFENGNWTNPSKLSDSDKDTDPAVAMEPGGNALAVWVSQGTSLSSSYYSKGSGWSSPKRLNLSGITGASLPELAFNPLDGNHYLVFTGGGKAYAAAYSPSGGWTAPLEIGQNAMPDNGIPTGQRTGISAAEGKNEVTAVWPGMDGNVYSAKLGNAAKNFNDGSMPDAAYDGSDVANGALGRAGDLFHQGDANDPNSPAVLVSGLAGNDSRPSLAFIRDRSVGLTVWWNSVVPPGQVFYSYHEDGGWKGAGQIDPSLSSDFDRNPAVSPFRSAKARNPPVPYCGDGLINLPFEMCEAGVACANPNQICNLANCQCVSPPNGSIRCAANSISSAFGFPLWAPGMACVDNCKAVFGNAYTCDATCNCVKGPPPPKANVSCSLNSQASVAGLNLLRPGDMCVDDCKQLGDEYKCDAVSCTCEKPPPKKDVSCIINTRGDILGLGKGQYRPGDMCRDDCMELGENYYCSSDCICQEKPDPRTYCAAHTQEVARTDKNDFTGATQCIDNCAELGDGYVCNAQSCTCTNPVKENISCSFNAIAEAFGAPKFNASIQQCKDDCAESYGRLSVVCDAQSCTCKEAEMTCAGNTLDTIDGLKNAYTGGQCVDNCMELGEGYQCDPQACVCREKPDPTIYCAAHTEDALIRGVEGKSAGSFNPSAQQCVDNCEAWGEGYLCNPQTCYCEPKNVTEVSCSFNYQLADATDSNVFNPSTQKCADDCAEFLGSQFECNAQSCTCTRKPRTDLSCAYNSLDIFGPPVVYNPSAHVCRDDCKEASLPGMELACNGQTCRCDAVIDCAGNTIDTIDGTGEISLIKYVLGVQCRDNCEELGEGYQCDPAECVCRKKTDEGTYCSANTFDVYVAGGLENGTHQRFTGGQCVDDCEQRLGEGMVCDPGSCFCIPAPGGVLSCSWHTDHVSVTDVNKFDPSKTQCSDDCPEGYQCDPSSCTCTSGTAPRPSCSGNTLTGNVGKFKLSLDTQCVDDCGATYGQTYVCDPVGCFCKETRTVTPRCGDGYVSNEFVGGGGVEQCDPAASPTGCFEGQACNSQCQCESEIPNCGDGKITAGEQCDWGNTSTNKCGSGLYCSGCECKKLETSPVCGDGKISVEAGEQCDGGSVYYNRCPSGQICELCKCVGSSALLRCGDGTVTPPEECDHGNTFTSQCPGGNTCYSCKCVDYASLSHAECDYSHGQCVSVQGPGQDECGSDSDCVLETQSCGNGEREGTEQCDGNDDSACSSGQSCNQDCQCQTSTTVTYHFECQQNACVQVQGSGTSVCDSDDDCVPPVVNCAAYCEGEGYGQVVQGSFSSATQCSSAAQESAEQCTTKCVYSKFYSVSNQAGTTTCCCKQVEVFQCSDCPGENPECPDPEVVCPANQP